MGFFKKDPVKECHELYLKVCDFLEEHKTITDPPENDSATLDHQIEVQKEARELREDSMRKLQDMDRQLMNTPVRSNEVLADIELLAHILDFERELRYKTSESKDPCHDLPPNFDVLTYSANKEKQLHLRGAIAGRLMYLECERRRMVIPQPSNGKDHRLGWLSDVKKQLNHLPGDRAWILDPTRFIDLEWMAMIEFAGTLTLLRKFYPCMFSIITEYCGIRKSLADPKELIVRRSSKDEVLSQPELIRGCPICSNGFTQAPVASFHRAIRLKECGCLFGSRCLESWVFSGQHNSSVCPSCRMPIVDREAVRKSLPSEWHKDVDAYMGFLNDGWAWDWEGDKEIDNFLIKYGSGDMEKCYGSDVAGIIIKLHVKYKEGLVLLNKLADRAEKECGKDLGDRIRKYWGHGK